jgi:hypothetical protein
LLSSFGWSVAGADLLWEKNIVVWLMADGWCWNNIKEKYWQQRASRTRPSGVAVDTGSLRSPPVEHYTLGQYRFSVANWAPPVQVCIFLCTRQLTTGYSMV